jgi:ATP-dependent helicase HrpB
MVITSGVLGLTQLACDIAALLQERDVVQSEGRERDVDLRARVQLLNRWRERGEGLRAAPAGADAATLNRVLRESDRLRRLMNAGNRPSDERATGLLLAFAYPDRIALRRDAVSSRFLLRNGTGAALPVAQALSASEAIVIAELDGRKPESRIWMAAPVDVADIIAHFGGQIEEESLHEWDEDSQSVRLVRREKLGALVLRERSSTAVDPDQTATILMKRIVEGKLRTLPWNPAASALRERIMFARHHEASWPDVSNETLLATVDEWLLPRLIGMRGMADVRRMDLNAILRDMLDWKRRTALDELAPSHIVMPTGSRIPVDYADPEAPMISVKLQEVFGMAETPKVMRGRVSLTVQLLSPAQRPVQVTRDLAGFWRTSYFDVRRDMRGRYPRHHWPDDPATATPRRHGKPRS